MNFIPAAVILLYSPLQIVQALLPYVSTDIASMSYTVILVCFCIKLGLKAWFIAPIARSEFLICSDMSFHWHM
jgi:hypothetical protein